jgi:hypothetical protein
LEALCSEKRLDLFKLSTNFISAKYKLWKGEKIKDEQIF